jgi:hypothetical protein
MNAFTATLFTAREYPRCRILIEGDGVAGEQRIDLASDLATE